MTGGRELWIALQHGDSAFPSSASAFSWGLETLVNDGRIGDADALRAFIESQLRHRWAPMDRPMLQRSYRASGEIAEIAMVDREIEAMALVPEFGAASRQMGRALLRVHARLDTPGATAYRELLRRDALPGHGLAVEGLVRWGQALGESDALVLSAYGLVNSLCGAMVRMGRLGPLESQAVMQRVAPVVEELIEDAPERPSASFVPETDAAGLRHEYGSMRIFGN